MRQMHDLSGQTFGLLKAIRRTDPPAGKDPKAVWWLCECSCKPGRTKVAMASMLRAGRVKSCGCLLSKHPEELLPKAPKKMARAGDHYGELELIEPVERPEGLNGRYGKCSWWRCRCSCGKEVIKPYAYIRSSPHPQCGHMDEEIQARKRKIGHDGQRYAAPATYDGHPIKKSKRERMYGCAIIPKACPQCRKTFDCYAGIDWAYKRKIGGTIRYFCSYGCKRKFDAAHPEVPWRAHD